MKVGYARTSREKQVAGLDSQLRDLEAYGCERIFHEQLSGADAARPKLAEAFSFVRDGDVFVVTKLDRLARSVAHLVEIEADLSKKGVTLVILGMSIDTSTPTGKLIFHVIGGIAQWEREMMLERQREGVQRAKDAGKYKGRAPTARRQTAQVLELRAANVRPTEIARRLGIGRTSVWTILKENQ